MTPQAQEIIAARKKREAELAFQKKLESGLGRFIAMRFERGSSISWLPTEMLARLVFLATYADYGGQLMYTKRTPMTKKLMSNAMGLSRNTFYRFCHAIVDSGIAQENSDGSLHLSEEYFLRGKFAKRTGYDNGWVKIFADQMRMLYRNTSVSRHRYLGAMLRMAPFLSTKYNLICRDPFENTLAEAIDSAMSMAEICSMLDIDPSNSTAYRTYCKRLSFFSDGNVHPFCSITRYESGPELVFLSPRVLFAGEDWEMVEGIITRQEEESATLLRETSPQLIVS